MFNLNKRMMERMMKQMGIKSENIEAEEVIIKTKEKDILINNPQVTKIKMGDRDTFQVIGEVSEKIKENFSEEDIKMIIEQTGASEEEVKKQLSETGDIAETIMKLKS